jgi:hypothetical protein
MDKNIFVKKYNPDVNNKFSSRADEKNLPNLNYKKELWKGITGNEFNMDIKDSKDFIIQFEKPDFNAITSKHQLEYMSRQTEISQIERKNKLIKEAALQNIMKLENNLVVSNQVENIKTHDELKQIQINDNDLLKEEKQKFNDILKNLESII